MKEIVGAVFFAVLTANAMAQAGGAAQGAQPVTSGPTQAEKLTTVLLAGALAAIIANNTASNH